jgi:hypothetical protein
MPVSCHDFSMRALSPNTAAENAASRPRPAEIKLLTRPCSAHKKLLLKEEIKIKASTARQKIENH